jgi:hypothetical protein
MGVVATKRTPPGALHSFCSQLNVHAALLTLARKKLLSLDELRRGIEALPPATEPYGYYYKWAASMSAIAVEVRVPESLCCSFSSAPWLELHPSEGVGVRGAAGLIHAPATKAQAQSQVQRLSARGCAEASHPRTSALCGLCVALLQRGLFSAQDISHALDPGAAEASAAGVGLSAPPQSSTCCCWFSCVSCLLLDLSLRDGSLR